jgi:hypothetical protein
MTVWVIRVWEEQAPAGEEPLEWILLTSVPTTTLEQAWERVDWYRHRWLVEDYHQCLKSGCRIEERQLQTVDGLIRLLGLLSPLAVRLVQIRGYARSQPERPANALIEPLMLAVVAQRSGHSPATMKAFTLLFTSLCKMWVRIRARSRGLLGVENPGPVVPRLYARYSKRHYGLSHAPHHSSHRYRLVATKACFAYARSHDRFAWCVQGAL